MSPKEEEEELSLIYRAKACRNTKRRTWRAASSPIRARRSTPWRAKIGSRPDGIRLALVAALSSFFSFVVGALIPVVPYLLTTGRVAWLASAAFSFAALFGVGALVSIFTARGPLVSGGRMVGIGLLVSAITYAVGWLLGVSIS